MALVSSSQSMEPFQSPRYCIVAMFSARISARIGPGIPTPTAAFNDSYRPTLVLSLRLELLSVGSRKRQLNQYFMSLNHYRVLRMEYWTSSEDRKHSYRDRLPTRCIVVSPIAAPGRPPPSPLPAPLGKHHKLYNLSYLVFS